MIIAIIASALVGLFVGMRIGWKWRTKYFMILAEKNLSIEERGTLGGLILKMKRD